jgi:hypothetical protein
MAVLAEKIYARVEAKKKSSLKERSEQLKAGNFVGDLRSVTTG